MDEVRIPALSALVERLTRRSTKLTLTLGLVIVTGLAAQATPASAFTGPPLWTCRGSALSVSIAGNNRVEPSVANGNPNTANGASPDRAQCVNSEVGANNLATPVGLPANFLGAPTVAATTTISPELGPAISQTATAVGRVENLTLALPAGGTVALGVGVANATATAKCVNGAPSLTGTSQATGITLGGSTVSLDQLLSQLGTALQPLNALVTLKVNEQIVTANTLTVRALHITLVSSGTMAPLADIILGEAKVGFTGEVCNPNVGPPLCPNSPNNPTTNDSAAMEQIEKMCGVEEPDGPAAINTNGYVVIMINGVPTQVPVNCAHIRMHFENNKKHAYTAVYGTERLVTRGDLKSCDQTQTVNNVPVHVPAGLPVINAKIDVIHVYSGKRVPQKTGLKSRGHGRLTLILPRNLTTRTIEYHYRGNLNLPTVTSRVNLRLTVRDRSGHLITGPAKGPQF